MKILLLGGTGYIGSAVRDRLSDQGHDVVLLVQDASPDSGTTSVLGDLADPASLRAAVTDDLDAVVHAATPLGDWEADAKAIDALLAPLRGTGRSLLYLSGTWVLGRTPAGADETAPQDPIALVSGRGLLEDAVTSAARDGVRGMVLRPGIVHGGGGGIPGMMVGWAREHGVGRHVGEPGVRWPMVHRDDLADLVLLALESGRPGQVLHGVAEAGVPVVALAEAADVAAGGAGRAQAWPQAVAAGTLGAPFAEALALDQVVHGTAARALGWTPTRVGAVEDVARGSYAEGQPAGR